MAPQPRRRVCFQASPECMEAQSTRPLVRHRSVRHAAPDGYCCHPARGFCSGAESTWSVLPRAGDGGWRDQDHDSQQGRQRGVAALDEDGMDARIGAGDSSPKNGCRPAESTCSLPLRSLRGVSSRPGRFRRSQPTSDHGAVFSLRAKPGGPCEEVTVLLGRPP